MPFHGIAFRNLASQTMQYRYCSAIRPSSQFRLFTSQFIPCVAFPSPITDVQCRSIAGLRIALPFHCCAMLSTLRDSVSSQFNSFPFLCLPLRRTSVAKPCGASLLRRTAASRASSPLRCLCQTMPSAAALYRFYAVLFNAGHFLLHADPVFASPCPCHATPNGAFPSLSAV